MLNRVTTDNVIVLRINNHTAFCGVRTANRCCKKGDGAVKIVVQRPAAGRREAGIFFLSTCKRMPPVLLLTMNGKAEVRKSAKILLFIPSLLCFMSAGSHNALEKRRKKTDKVKKAKNFFNLLLFGHFEFR